MSRYITDAKMVAAAAWGDGMEGDDSGRQGGWRPRPVRRATPGRRRGRRYVRTGTRTRDAAGDDGASVLDDAIHPATAVLQNDYIRRYLGTFIHTATRNDIRSRVAAHRAIPALVWDLAELSRQRERRWSCVLAAVISLARHPRSRDADDNERDALRDAWSGILEGAPNRRAARTAATRQVTAWRVSDALPWLVSAMPPRVLFVDGIIRAPDLVAAVAAQTRPRNALRLRNVATLLAESEDAASASIGSTQAVARREALIDALAPAYHVDMAQPTTTDTLRAHVSAWIAHGWLPLLLAALPASLDWEAGDGLDGVARLGHAMRAAYCQAQRMRWSDEVYAAASFFASTSVDERIPHRYRFRMVYALHDALRDADNRPSSSVDAIDAQFGVWHRAGVLPLLVAATIDDYFYRDGRLRLSDIDAHLTREWALMRSLPPSIRRAFYDPGYSAVPTNDAGPALSPAVPAHVEDSAMLAVYPYLHARAAENQFRILEGILLRTCTDFLARRYLQNGLHALRDSPLVASFNETFTASWYETL